MTYTSAIVSGNTRKAWVDDARGNTTSSKRSKDMGVLRGKSTGAYRTMLNHKQHTLDMKTKHQPTPTSKVGQVTSTVSKRDSAR